MKRSVIKKRREEVSHCLVRRMKELEIAEKLGVSRQTIVRDVAFLKGETQKWFSGLADQGFIFEFKTSVDHMEENMAELRKLFDETTDVKQKIAIIKTINEIEKLRLELLSESPSIYTFRKAMDKGNVCLS